MPYPENRKQNHKWKVILYHDCSKKEIAKIYTLDTIKQVSYILDIETGEITRKEPKGIEKIILDVMDWFKYGRTDPENRDYK